MISFSLNNLLKTKNPEDNMNSAPIVGEHVDFLDIAKGIAIILIVLGHTGFLGERILTFLYSFHVQTFFVVTGLLLGMTGKSRLRGDGFKKYVSKRAALLFIPYISFSLIYIVIDCITFFAHITSADLIRDAVINTLTLFGDSTLWFLPTLFIAEILFMLLAQRWDGVPLLAVSVAVALIGIIGSSVVMPHFDGLKEYIAMKILFNILVAFFRPLVCVPLLAVGYLSYTGFFKKFVTDSPKGKMDIPVKDRRILSAIGVVAIVFTFFSSGTNAKVDINLIDLGNYFPTFYINSIFGAFGVIFISAGIKHFSLLSFFGKNSLTVMCTHLNCYVMYLGIQIAWMVDAFVTRAKSYVFNAVIMVVVLAVEILIIPIVNKFLPFLIGKHYNRVD